MNKPKTAETTRQPASRLRHMVENLPVGAAYIVGDVFFLNRAAERMTGYSCADLPTLDAWFDTLFGTEADEVRALYEQQRRQGFTESATLSIRHRDNSSRWIQFTGIRSENEEAWLLQDITKRKFAEEALRVSEERYALAMQGSQDGLWDWDIRTGKVFFSARWKSMVGYAPNELPDHVDTWKLLLHPDDQARVFETLQAYFARRISVYEVEFRFRHRDGSYRWILACGVAHFDDDNQPYRMAGCHTDITERKEAEQRLLESQRFTERIAEASPDILYIYDLHERRNVYTNREISTILGYAPGDIQQMGNKFLPSLMHPDDLPQIQAYHHAFREAADGELREIEYRMLHANGEWRWLHSRDTVFSRTETGEARQVLGSAQDITERRQLDAQVQQNLDLISRQNATLEAQKGELQQALAGMEAANIRLETLATTDGLTGLTNHRAFQERLAESFAHSRRSRTALSVVLLDVDKFKQFNDTYGHQAGDQVLKQVADILRDTMRETDLTARYGGEEFVVLLPNTIAEEACIAAERLRIAIENAPWTQRAITISLGVATRTGEMMLGSQIVAAADKALYRSKQLGRNRLTHADTLEEALLSGDSTLTPYTALFHEMLQAQQDTLLSSSERIRLVMAQTYDATIESWARLLDLRDKETEGHSSRVTELTVRLTEFIGLNSEEIMYARWGALLHDIGKMGVPDQILLKPGPLTDEERAIMQRHTTLAYEMLWPIEFLRPAIDIPYCHHEKWDGTGYPRGMRGDDIPLTARLFAVIDVYDALRSDRPYRAGWEEGRVREYLQEQSGAHFDPRAVRTFLRMLTEQDDREFEQPRAA